jgi:hypothetical protein
MAVMATDGIPYLHFCLFCLLWHSHLHQLFMKLPSVSIFTLVFYIDGATGSQSGPGDSAYGESACPSFSFP